MKQNNNYKYPCTRNIGIDGFGSFLEQEIKEPRRNIRLFTQEFGNSIAANGDNPANRIVLTGSGSSANLVAALALAEKCKKSNRPLYAVTSAFTFPTTMSALILAGFKVKIIDVEQRGFNLDIDLLQQEKEAPSVVVVTHFLGFPADMQKLSEYRRLTGCYILQDACETLEATIDGQPLYSFGDIVTWSFYHPHHLSSYGGGAVYAANKDDYILLDSITHWGRACTCHIDESTCTVHAGPAHQFTYERLGVNVEMSELNACFGRWQLRNWREIETRRQENYRHLYAALKDKTNIVVWPFYNPECNSPFVFPIMTPSKTVNEIFDILAPLGIEIRTLMGGATPTQNAFKDLTSCDSCPEAIFMAQHTFFVGCHSTLSTEDIDHIANVIASIL